MIGVEAKDITAQDLKKSIKLLVKNEKGEADFQVILSNEAPPLGKLKFINNIIQF